MTDREPVRASVLSFEEFSRKTGGEGGWPKWPRYDNFAFTFAPRYSRLLDTLDPAKSAPKVRAYQTFRRENPKLYEDLSREMAIIDGLPRGDEFVDTLGNQDAKLYEAYVIMRGYDGITDRDLFS